ncbi:hypothetical protein MMC12_001351 [Toensbergia leucococca]|nr:hypothetical protein [Toensbergia leucococca]
MSSTNFLSYIGWTFLPNLVTGWIQTIYYGIVIRAGDPKPQPGTPRYQKHRRRIFITVVAAYLLYTIFEADYDLRRAGDFYQDLGLPLDVDERGIKTRFRRLAAIYHPDKVSSASSNTSTTEAYFVHLKTAQDTLLNPTKRFAYDRFGPDMLSWQHCSSISDYLLSGLQRTGPFYAGSGLFMLILSITGYLQWGRFWRYLTFLTLLTLELHTLTRPFPPPLLNLLNPVLTHTPHPPLLPFQLLTLARKTTLTLFIALSQLGPLFSPSQPSSQSQPPNTPETTQLLTRLEALVKATEAESSRLLGLDMAPFAGDEGAVRDLRGRVREWLVQNTIRADPEVRDAMGRVLGRRRVGGVPGRG